MSKCTICGRSYPSVVKPTRHHKKPQHLGGKSNKHNISMLSEAEHHAWNVLTNFNQLLPHEIARLINEKYLDPDYRFNCIKKRKGGQR